MFDEQDKEYTSNTIGEAERTGSKFPRKGESCSSPFTALPLFGMQGYIKTYRKSLDSSVWWKSPIVWQVWSWCLLKAHFAERDLPTSEGDIILEPGQFVSWRKKSIAELPISEQNFRTAIKYLKLTNRITTKTTNKYSIYTVISWAKYQETNQPTNKKLTSNQPATNPIYKKDKNVKNDKNIYIDRVPTSQDEVSTYFTELGYPKDEALKYYDHFQSNGWKVGGKTPMKDWKAAARNWCRRLPKEVKRAPTKPEPTPERPVYTKEEEALAQKARDELKNKLGVRVPR